MISRLGRLADGPVQDAALYALSAGFALLTATTSTLLPHRAWGALAMWGYLGALLTVLAFRWRHPTARIALTWAAWASTTLLPLVAEAIQRAGGRTDRAQDEVLVVEQMGRHLLERGTPYLSADAIRALPAGARLLGYSPYQPGMAVFGLPRALGGVAWWTDARIWFALVTVLALAATARLLFRGRPRETVRAMQAATVLPTCALTLATGGDDLPVLALCLLALACCARDRFVLAGVAIGAAAAMKLFALPVLLVLLVLAANAGPLMRAADAGLSGDAFGRTDAARRVGLFIVGALGVPAVTLVPVLWVDAGAVLENVIRFPLGHGVVTSPAQSPFPGYLIATLLPAGHVVAAVLLAVAALTIGWLLVRRAPRTASAAARYAGWGLLSAIMLMPTTRFGYLLYPIALLVIAPALTRPGRPTADATPHDPKTAPPHELPAHSVEQNHSVEQ